jgi:hypothetical protein
MCILSSGYSLGLMSTSVTKGGAQKIPKKCMIVEKFNEKL